MSSDPWGRVDETGTVYVRTADGEQVVGSWQAGSPEEALAYFERKYEGLVVEIGLLEKRVKTTDLSAKDAQAAIDHIREQVDAHHAVGDLDALEVRLDKLVATVDARREERKAAARQAVRRGPARQGGAGRRGRGAGRRATSGGPPVSGCARWWTPGRVCRAWTASRTTSCGTASRTPARRSPSAARRTSRRWTRSARRPAGPRRSWSPRPRRCPARRTGVRRPPRYRELMAEWKAAGRAQREHEDDLWNRFRGAQDVFFAARSCGLRRAGRRADGEPGAKEELAEEAEKLLPVGDLKAARAAFRAINERWEAIGHVPRDARPKVEGRMHAVERALQEAEETEWRRTNPEARARAAGSDRPAPGRRGQAAGARSTRPAPQGNTAKADKLGAELEGRQALLDQALKGLQEFGG